jgi:hypothetical protein
MIAKRIISEPDGIIDREDLSAANDASLAGKQSSTFFDSSSQGFVVIDHRLVLEFVSLRSCSPDTVAEIPGNSLSKHRHPTFLNWSQVAPLAERRFSML